MAARTPGVAKSRNPSRGRAQHPKRPKPTHARETSSRNGSAGRPAASGAFTQMTREYRAGYPASRERKDLYPFTISGEPIQPLYGPEDLAGIDLARDIAVPGHTSISKRARTSAGSSANTVRSATRNEAYSASSRP